MGALTFAAGLAYADSSAHRGDQLDSYQAEQHVVASLAQRNDSSEPADAATLPGQMHTFELPRVPSDDSAGLNPLLSTFMQPAPPPPPRRPHRARRIGRIHSAPTATTPPRGGGAGGMGGGGMSSGGMSSGGMSGGAGMSGGMGGGAGMSGGMGGGAGMGEEQKGLVSGLACPVLHALQL